PRAEEAVPAGGKRSWAGLRARVKDGRCRSATSTPGVIGLQLPPDPAHRRRLLTMKPVSRRTLDWIYSVVAGLVGLHGVDSLGPKAEGSLFLQRPGTPKSISEISFAIPNLDSASSWGTRSSAPYLLFAIVLLSWGYVIYASTVAARRQLRKEYPDKIFGMSEN
ncbi:LOW QUALITY PROTEIN: Small integral membrane protein 27, partial [Galemys pyrenaicus]